MYKTIIRGLLILCLGLSGVVLMAQEDMTTFDIEDTDLSIMFPEDWEQTTTDEGVVELTTDGLLMMVHTPDVVAELFDLGDADSSPEVLEVVIADVSMGDDVELDPEAIKTVAINQRRAARINFETDETTGGLVAVLLSDRESIGVVSYIITTEDVDDVEELTATIDEVVASFDIGDGSSAGEGESGGEACVLSTADANTVQLRVGPGFNRTVIAFLPASVDFEALGQTTDDDGAVWFRLDETLAAPGKAVNEIWVLGDDVDQSGDCANVVDDDAPPIIPITQPQPTAVPQTDASGETTAPEGPAVPETVTDSSGAIVPEQGTWMMEFNSGNVECDFGFSGGANPVTGSITDTLVGGGSAGFTFDGDFYEFIGDNTYQTFTIYSLESGGEAVVRFTFTMTSSRTATGSYGAVVDRCTYFAPLTLNYIGG